MRLQDFRGNFPEMIAQVISQFLVEFLRTALNVLPNGNLGVFDGEEVLEDVDLCADEEVLWCVVFRVLGVCPWANVAIF